MTLSEIRKNARADLENKWGTAALIMLIYSLIELGISIVYMIISHIPFMGLLAYAGLITISVPISFGLYFSFIELKRGNDVGCTDYLNLGFSNFKRVWCITGNILKKLWIYILLYFIICFAMTFAIGLIIVFSISFSSRAFAVFGCLSILILCSIFITLYVLFIMKSLSYVLVAYIAWDNPDMSAKDVVEKSEKLMQGHRGEYFLLGLSFIGWILLSMLTLGIGLLWLIPYIETSFIVFYENRLKEEDGNNDNDNKNTIEASNEPKKIEEPVNNTEKMEITEESSTTVTEVDEEDIKKVDVLDDDGNIIE